MTPGSGNPHFSIKNWNNWRCIHEEGLTQRAAILLSGLLTTSKTHKSLKERFLIKQNRTKHAKFWGSPLFQAMYNTEKKNKQLIQLINFILCQLDAWRLAEGGKKLFPSASLLASNWHKISWINCLFYFCCMQLEKEDFLENLHVLSCFVKIKSVLLISCVFWIFFQNAGSQPCFRFFFVFCL